MNTPLTFTPSEAGLRLDSWLTAQLAAVQPADAYSRARVQALIKQHYLTRNGVMEANPARKIKAGEAYVLTLPPPEDTTLLAEDIPLEVLFEDEHLIVINKPAGLPVHPSKGHLTGTLVHALLHHCKGTLSGINGEQRPGIVHRLDMDTSGVMVAVKHDKAHRNLARQFAKHSIHRKYVALVRGVPKPLSGTVVGAIGRHPVNRLKRAVVAAGTGKHAITHYQTLQTFGATASLVACTLETGRTHQIRIHMAHLGHPLVGDKMYGPHAPTTLPAARQMLHAAELSFIHPITNTPLAFTCPLPTDMQTLLETLA
ncbi:MAG: RluA family pseudouridine synthase [Alphaproteobacteria bacterium]